MRCSRKHAGNAVTRNTRAIVSATSTRLPASNVFTRKTFKSKPSKLELSTRLTKERGVVLAASGLSDLCAKGQEHRPRVCAIIIISEIRCPPRWRLPRKDETTAGAGIHRGRTFALTVSVYTSLCLSLPCNSLGGEYPLRRRSSATSRSVVYISAVARPTHKLTTNYQS